MRGYCCIFMELEKESKIKDVCASIVFKSLFQVEGNLVGVTKSYTEYNCNYHTYSRRLLQV